MRLLPWARNRLLAALAGAVLAGAPMLAFYHWLNGLIERRGWEEVDYSARRSIAVAEVRLDQVLAGLDELSRREISACRGTHLDAMRQMTFNVTVIKEISVVAADGQTMCSDSGLPLAPRTLLAAQRVSPSGVVMLELIRIADQASPVIRVRRPRAGPGLAAVMPADALILRVSNRGEPLSAFLSMSLSDGTLIAAAGSELDHREEHLTATAQSARYGLVVRVAMARGSPANAAELQSLGMVIPGVIALAIFGFALLVPWRAKNNPIDEIRRALQAGEFVPYYQPVVDIKTGRVTGAEVLVRWRRADGSIVSPGAFIPLVESSDLVVELTRSLVRRACEEVGKVYATRPHLKLAFNLAARHFADESIVKDVRDIVEQSDVKMSQIVLEVTERQPLDDLTATRRVIAALQGAGVRVALDDVGTGHSGLSYILKLGVDIIKIDKMFIDAIGSESNSGTIIETLVDLARNMRMEIIAEGVERFDQVIYLRDLGIRSAQGHVFAPPLPTSSYLKLIEAADPIPAPSEEEKEERAARRLRAAG